jgi:hypothetical protein
MSPWDKSVRQAAKNWFSHIIRAPSALFDGVQIQTIGIIQAPDVQPNGQADMCDSCPDMTVWNGTLINSCRMDEYRLFGDMLSVAHKPAASPELGEFLVDESFEDKVALEPGLLKRG